MSDSTTVPEPPKSTGAVIPELKIVAAIGEILWDVFPDGARLGGAPANFVHHIRMLGRDAYLASRIGRDELGDGVLATLRAFRLPPICIQVDDEYPTGTVEVRLDAEGRPDYDITEDVAWDHITWQPSLKKLAEWADAVCFGTLAQRSPVSRHAIRRLLESVRPGTPRFLDINLRGNYYDAKIIGSSLGMASVLKLNDEELPRVMDLLGMKKEGEEDAARALLEKYELEMVVLTRGERGSLLVTASESDSHPGFKVRVADTVGSGDAFLAAVVHHWLKGAPLARINEAANRLGSFVATQPGAMPFTPRAILLEVD